MVYVCFLVDFVPYIRVCIWLVRIVSYTIYIYIASFRRGLEKSKYTVISRNTLVKAELHLENAEIHLKIVQMNLQWIENDEINLKKFNSKTKTTRFSATQI